MVNLEVAAVGVVLPCVLHHAVGKGGDGAALAPGDVHPAVEVPRGALDRVGAVAIPRGQPAGDGGHGLQLPQGQLVHGVVVRQGRPVIVRHLDHRPGGQDLGLDRLLFRRLLRGRRGGEDRPQRLPPGVVLGALQGVWTAAEEGQLRGQHRRCRGRSEQCRRLRLRLLGTEYLDTELPQVGQHRVPLRQGTAQAGQRPSEIKIGGDHPPQLFPQLCHPARKQAPAEKDGEKQSQTHAQLGQQHPVPSAAPCPAAPPGPWTASCGPARSPRCPRPLLVHGVPLPVHF